MIKEDSDESSVTAPIWPPFEDPDVGRGYDAEERSAGADVVGPGTEVGPLPGETRRNGDVGRRVLASGWLIIPSSEELLSGILGSVWKPRFGELFRSCSWRSES